MPIYDYRCNNCGGLYDVYHKVREIQEDVICPSCSSRDHRKLMSVPYVAVASPASKKADSCSMGDSCCGGVCSVN